MEKDIVNIQGSDKLQTSIPESVSALSAGELSETAKFYASLGISGLVHAYGEQIIESLKSRFAQIEQTAEYNQLKVIKAMQNAKVSEACLLGTTGDRKSVV